MTRLYTALQAGAVVRRGSFSDEELLRLDFPAPAYELVLDEHRDFPAPVGTYADQRRMAYPPLAEFADALFWQSEGDGSKLDAYLATIKAVKEQFPKP